MAKVVVRTVEADAWQTMRDVRLAALHDAPHAFGSSYQRSFAVTGERKPLPSCPELAEIAMARAA